MLDMDLSANPTDCSHGYSDLPTESFLTKVKIEIDDVPVREEMACGDHKGETTQGKVKLQQSPCFIDVIIPGIRNQSTSVDVVTPKTELSEIHPTFQEDNSSVFRKCKLDPETQSVISCPGPSSVRDDIEHPRQHLPRDIVKQEVLDTDDHKTLLDSYVKDQNMDNLVFNSEDTKPAVDLSCSTANSASVHTQCVMESHDDSSTSPGLMPVGLYYNKGHLRHLVESEVRKLQPGMDNVVEEGRNGADNTGEMESELGLCDKSLRSFLLTRGRVDHREQTNVNDTARDPINDLFSDHELPVCDKEVLHVGDSGDHRGQSGVNDPVNDLSTPKPTHKGGKPYRCKFCSKPFSYLGSLKSHEQAHRGEKPYTCNICNRGFSESGNLKRHKRTHTGEKPYTCNICNTAFALLGGLKRHERTHTGEKPYTCKFCSKAFSQSFHLKMHERGHTGEKPYPCKFCNKAFSQFSNLKKHKRVHSGGKPFSCNICNKAFSESGNLKRHERTHTGETKPYSCYICNKTFSQLFNLKIHERVHTGEKPYSCKFCSKAFSQLGNLKQHERTHTGDTKPYSCNICKKAFSLLGDLKKHEGTHTPGKP